MKPIEVNILGQSYVLTCPEGGQDALLQAVSLVNHEMSSIRDAGRVKAREKIAVLASLNLAYALVDARAKQAAEVMQFEQNNSNFQPNSDFPIQANQNYTQNSPGLNQNFQGLDVNNLIERIDSTLAPQTNTQQTHFI